MESETENREAVERYAAAWTAGDMAALVGCYHDDFTLHYGGDNALTGTHRGKAKCLGVMQEFGKRCGGRKLVRVVATMAGAERGGMIAREALGPDGIEMDRVFLYAVKDGKLAECWLYDSDQGLIDRMVGK